MKVSREKAAENRERVIEAAAALFRARGFDGIGVAEIMKAADLTHGGFYGQFSSKDDLIAQASRHTLERSAAKWQRIVAEAGGRPYAALLKNYLTPRHRDQPNRGCAIAALGTDVARSGSRDVRETFAEGLESLLGILAESASGAGSKAARRRKAITAMAALVGAVTLARAVGDSALSDEILATVQRELLAGAGMS
jgi:TetR/AcrR family transcriptional repressor of nem operon